MDPMTLFAGLSAASSVAQGVAGYASGMDDAARADSEAALAETQALQRDTQSRDDLLAFLGTMRAARAANGLSSSSPNAFILEKENRETADRDRIRQRADDRQRAANYRSAAKSYRRGARMSLATGVIKGGVPLAEYGAYKYG